LLRGVRNMRNPFEYGVVVSGEAFCNREKETGDLVRAMQNAEKLFVFSERRYGKTSLVPAALGRLPRKGHVCLMWVCGRQTARRVGPPWPRRIAEQLARCLGQVWRRPGSPCAAVDECDDGRG
jgi:hypothetical protein